MTPTTRPPNVNAPVVHTLLDARPGDVFRFINRGNGRPEYQRLRINAGGLLVPILRLYDGEEFQVSGNELIRVTIPNEHAADTVVDH